MEIIELYAPTSISTIGGDPIISKPVDHLYGPDGFIASIWPEAKINDAEDVILNIMGEYKHPFRHTEKDLSKIVRAGRYDIIIAKWDPDLALWGGDVLVPIDQKTCKDCTTVLTPLYRSRIIKFPTGQLFYYGVDKKDPLVLPTSRLDVDISPDASKNPSEVILDLIQKKYGDPT